MFATFKCHLNVMFQMATSLEFEKGSACFDGKSRVLRNLDVASLC